MTYLQSIILGLVEGLTEFLPISSTYHLLTVSRSLSLTPSDFLTSFEVVIQAGAILALLVLYLRIFFQKPQLSFKVALSFFPTAIVGFVLYSFIKNTLFNSSLASWYVFILVGLFFFLAEYLVKKGKIIPHRSLTSLSYQECLLIGLAQATSVIPGVSRAGSVILAMMFLGFRRDEAARYTFLLSLPTILAASGFDLLRHPEIITNADNVLLLFIGLITSFLSAMLVMRWFIRFLGSHTLIPFAYYRLIMALIILLTLGL